jgi:hypothetical protein
MPPCSQVGLQLVSLLLQVLEAHLQIGIQLGNLVLLLLLHFTAASQSLKLGLEDLYVAL